MWLPFIDTHCTYNYTACTLWFAWDALKEALPKNQQFEQLRKDKKAPSLL